MWRRAAHEPRIQIALALILAAVPIGWYAKHQAETRANDDFAACGGARPAPDCTSKQQPISTTETTSVGSNGYDQSWSISVQTGPHSFFSMSGLSHDTVRPFEHASTAEARYHDGRLAAVVAQDGTALKVPFAFTRTLAVEGGAVGVLVLAAGGLIAWGFTRVNALPSAAA